MSDWATIKLDVLSSELKSGEIRVSLGDRSQEQGAISDATLWGMPGFITRPLDPDDRGACMALFQFEGNNRRILGLKDNRYTDKYGDIAPGDSAIVTDGDARIIVKREGDSVSIVSTDQILQLNGQDKSFTLVIGSDTGTAMIKVKNNTIVLAVDGASLMISRDGVTISGPHFACNTGGGNLGTIGPLAPVAPVNSIIYGVTGNTGAPASHWVVSPA